MLVAISGPPRLVIKCPTFGWIRVKPYVYGMSNCSVNTIVDFDRKANCQCNQQCLKGHKWLCFDTSLTEHLGKLAILATQVNLGCLETALNYFLWTQT